MIIACTFQLNSRGGFILSSIITGMPWSQMPSLLLWGQTSQVNDALLKNDMFVRKNEVSDGQTTFFS